MDISAYMVSDAQWLTKDAVTYKGANVVISAVTQEVVGLEKENKLALHFKGDIKPMLLNKVNLKILAAMFGTDTKEWMGETVNVFNDPTVNFNGAQGGLRLRPATAERKAPDVAERYAQAAMADAKTLAAAKTRADFDDDIPF